MEYHTGKVLEVLQAGTEYDAFTQQAVPYQQVKALLDTGEVVVVDYGSVYALQPEQLVDVGNAVIIVAGEGSAGLQYSIIDHYRLPWMGLVIGIFVLAVLVTTRWKGLGSLISLAISLLVLVGWLVPQLLVTAHPLVITFATLVGLSIMTFYLGHGVNRATTIALVCTITVLGLALLVAMGTTSLLQLSGVGSEAALSIKYGFGENIQLKGLLLAGLLIGALGVLDDVTIAQAQAVRELKLANPGLSRRQLFKQSYRIGQAHIVALVNTLMLAYAGAALPAFLVLSNYSVQPLWVSLNSETLMEEMIQMLIGSMTLIIAVPLTTLVAVWGVNLRPR